MFKQVTWAAAAAAALLLTPAFADTLAAQLPSEIWISRSTLQSLPMSGASWTALQNAANQSCGTPDLANQEDSANVCVMAKALVFARTGQSQYRTAVVTALTSVANMATYDGRALALGRELAAYVIAADLIDLQNYSPSLDNVFRAKLWTLLLTPTTDGPVNLIDCHESRPNNWGTHCGASRAAVAAYLGDTVQLDRTAKVFKGWLGDRASYAGFAYGDLSWQCDGNNPVGVNRAGCTKSGYSIDGVLPDDQRRAGTGFVWPPPKENYVYEALQGALAQAIILHRAGYDVFNWENRALLRAFSWLHNQANFDAAGDDSWQPHVVNHFYAGQAPALPAPTPSSPGKNVGFTDWTHQGAATSSSTPILVVNPTSLSFSAVQGGANPAPKTAQVTNGGSGSLSWTAAVSDSRWSVSPTSGGAGATITVAPSSAGLAAGTYQATLSISSGGAQGSPKTVALTLTVTAATTTVRVNAISLAPSTVMGGLSSTATVTLSAPAPAGGAIVSLASSSSRASVPSTALVPGGASAASFNVNTTTVHSSSKATISASLNGSAQAVLTIAKTVDGGAGGGSIGGSTGTTGQDLGAEADTFVRGGTYAGVNFGTANDLEVKDASSNSYDRRAFLRFNLSTVTSLSSATLRLYVASLPNGSGVPVCVYAVSNDVWTETGLTWSSQPAAGNALACQTVTATGWISVNVTAAVQQELAGDRKLSIVVTDNTQTNRAVEFSSRQMSTNRPVLEIR